MRDGLVMPPRPTRLLISQIALFYRPDVTLTFVQKRTLGLIVTSPRGRKRRRTTRIQIGHADAGVQRPARPASFTAPTGATVQARALYLPILITDMHLHTAQWMSFALGMTQVPLWDSQGSQDPPMLAWLTCAGPYRGPSSLVGLLESRL